jgi:HAD superfamily hydrolase (TIGR01509 family)
MPLLISSVLFIDQFGVAVRFYPIYPISLYQKGADSLDIKGLLIDFGSTLAYLDDSKFRKYEAALVLAIKKFGYKSHLEDLSEILASVYRESSRGELKTPQEFWSQMLRKLGIPEKPKLADTLQEITDSYANKFWKLYDQVSETLTILQSKYRLALVSNCSVGTDKIIRSVGLADFFECITLSYQVGARKPDKRVYLEALKCLGLEANECVFVADEISDLEGAKEVGLKTILVLQGTNLFTEAKDLNFKPDFEIEKISEVTSIV